ncbi:MAG TPA: DUF302 domain-containing protein [Acidobacteriota bacterium]|nr:DUF302 domain-containing protein [Acidobacteriota bacterium]HRR25607.1 DUF302 domain-containing protein [Acidobacteriota bacterium]HRV08691.1 DUF302 domain-containing protein [Acidobacteriota bacterium]
MRPSDLGWVKTLPGLDLAGAEERVKAALKEEGFGVLTRIDVAETLRQKLGVHFKPYVILGVCNPEVAHQVLSHDDAAGLLLPCNVVLTEEPEGVQVALARPQAMFRMVGSAESVPAVEEAEAKIRRVFERL